MNQEHAQESKRIGATVNNMASYADDHKNARKRIANKSHWLNRVQQGINSDAFVRIVVPVLLVLFILFGLVPWISLIALTTNDLMSGW